jgi:hypothetical protein
MLPACRLRGMTNDETPMTNQIRTLKPENSATSAPPRETSAPGPPGCRSARSSRLLFELLLRPVTPHPHPHPPTSPTKRNGTTWNVFAATGAARTCVFRNFRDDPEFCVPPAQAAVGEAGLHARGTFRDEVERNGSLFSRPNLAARAQRGATFSSLRGRVPRLPSRTTHHVLCIYANFVTPGIATTGSGTLSDHSYAVGPSRSVLARHSSHVSDLPV